MAAAAEPKAKKEQYELHCSKALDLAFSCTTPGNQFTTYYRTGEMDDCRETWGDMFRCFRAKMMPPSKAEAYVKGTRLEKVEMLYETNVWESKEKPGW